MKKITVYDMTLIAMFTVLTIIGGKISFQVLTIPFTFQVVVALLTGAVLGARRAFLSQLLYLLMGLAGLPVFSKGGGLTYVFQMSFGYIIGFLFAATLVGYLADKADSERKNLRLILAVPIMLAGLVVIYSFGILHMLVLKNLYTQDSLALIKALQIGVVPFLLTDGAWCLLAALITPRLRRLSRPFMNKVIARSGKKISGINS